MKFEKIVDRAREVRRGYAKLEKEKYGKKWEAQQLMQGFVGDVGDLSKLVTAKEGLRDVNDVDDKLEHELADCLWSVMALADEYGIDIKKAFLKNMDRLEERIKNN